MLLFMTLFSCIEYYYIMYCYDVNTLQSSNGNVLCLNLFVCNVFILLHFIFIAHKVT